MHNIGSVTQETGLNEFGEFESLNEFGEFEAMNEFGEFEGGELSLGEFGELAGEGELNEMQEYELAAELLAVSNEQELEQFLGNVFRRAASAVGRFASSQAGKALGGILKNVARQALPVVGSALGNFIVPGVGGAIGGKLAGMAGRALGLELEGLSAEDREFEVARRVVRLSAASARQLARTPGHIDPQIAARRAFTLAARQVAPGIMNSMRGLASGALNAAATSAGQAFGQAAQAAQALGQPIATGCAGGPGQGMCPSCAAGRQAVVRRSRDGRGLVIYVKLR